MGQEEVLDLLKENKGWMTSLEISNKLKKSRSTVSMLLNRLYKFEEVLRMEDPRARPITYLWRYKK